MIHYQYDDHVVPGVFILMENKREILYNSVFIALRDRMPANLQGGPEHFSVDFELAPTNAFKAVFPNSTEAFCFFHFAQSL